MAGEMIDGKWPVDGWSRTVQAISETTDEEAWLYSATAGLDEVGRAAVTAAWENCVETVGADGDDPVVCAEAEAEFYRVAMDQWSRFGGPPLHIADEAKAALAAEMEIARLRRMAGVEAVTSAPGLNAEALDAVAGLHRGFPTLAHIAVSEPGDPARNVVGVLAAAMRRGGLAEEAVDRYLDDGEINDGLTPRQVEQAAAHMRWTADETARRMENELAAAGERDAAAVAKRTRNELVRDRMPDDPFIRRIYAEMTGQEGFRFAQKDEIAVREASVARHGGLGKAESRASAAAEAARKAGWSNCDVTDAIKEAAAIRRIAQDVIKTHCGDLREAIDISDVIEGVEGCPPDERRLMTIEKVVDALEALGESPARDRAIAALHGEMDRISLVSSAPVPLRKAAQSWFKVKEAHDMAVRSVTTENGKVVAMVGGPGRDAVRVVDDGRRISCPTNDHEAIALAVKAFAARGTKTLRLKAGDPERQLIGAFECLKAGIEPQCGLPVKEMRFLRDLVEAERTARKDLAHERDVPDRVRVVMMSLGHDAYDIDVGVGLVTKGRWDRSDIDEAWMDREEDALLRRDSGTMPARRPEPEVFRGPGI